MTRRALVRASWSFCIFFRSVISLHSTRIRVTFPFSSFIGESVKSTYTTSPDCERCVTSLRINSPFDALRIYHFNCSCNSGLCDHHGVSQKYWLYIDSRSLAIKLFAVEFVWISCPFGLRIPRNQNALLNTVRKRFSLSCLSCSSFFRSVISWIVPSIDMRSPLCVSFELSKTMYPANFSCILSDSTIFFIEFFSLSNNFIKKIFLHHFLIVWMNDSKPTINSLIIRLRNSPNIVEHKRTFPYSCFKIKSERTNICLFLRFSEKIFTFL